MIPASLDLIEKLCSRRIGELIHLFAAQPEMKKVRHHQERLSVVELRRSVNGHREQLIERIDSQELGSRPLVNLRSRYQPERFLQHALGAFVTVVIRSADQLVLTIEESIINSPRIGSNRYDLISEFLDRQRQAVFDLRPERQNVPVKMIAGIHRAVRKAVQLLEREASFLRRRHLQTT